MKSYFQQDDCNLNDFDKLISRQLHLDARSPALSAENNIPIYDAQAITDWLSNIAKRQALMAEWTDVLVNQSGVLVIKNAIADHHVIDAATAIYNDIIVSERSKQTGGDHFAGSGANDRIWNSLQKLCMADPSIFIQYFSSLSIATVCEAYLGPDYQMTAQVNLVRPGGKAQIAHRDYHLGFMGAEQAALYPAHAHMISTGITLQGAVAHCDMSIESGPTKLLPFSQTYDLGYLAVHRSDFRERFEECYVQIPLEKGDAIFFSPALFHAAGDNNSVDIHRMANLMQISSAMGRSIETINRDAMVKKLYPAFQACSLPVLERDAAIAAAAEGYSFPTNLDQDPPIGGLSSESQARLLKRALEEKMTYTDFEAALIAQNSKRKA